MTAEQIERTPETVEPWLAAGAPLGRAGFPADIANAALWLASSESSFVTGHALVVDGGLTAGNRWSKNAADFNRLREVEWLVTSIDGNMKLVPETSNERLTLSLWYPGVQKTCDAKAA